MKRTILFYSLILLLTACASSDADQVNPDDPTNETPPVDDPIEDVSTGKSTKQINVNGTNRDYILYVPENYTGDTPLPLLFSFHGLGSSMENLYRKSKFDELAESENFIVVYPEAIDEQWNLSAADNPDIDFVNALLDALEEGLNIDANRIYSTGMSNGGNISFLLACELSDKIAAIASVTGLNLHLQLNETCGTTRPIAVLQIHGTQDPIARYIFVEPTLQYWIDYNNTEANPTITPIPDTNTGDGSTVERIAYSNGNQGTEVHILKVIGGGHQWPGHKGNMDINASEEVWNFVKKYDLNGIIE